MINVTLVNHPTVSPLCLAEHAAKVCYQGEIPLIKSEDSDVVNFVNNKLFQTGHHTTLQHQFFTFVIEDIAISDITFGLHLNSPFYNSDQRSGRFCSKMFINPDYTWVKNYIEFFWPNLKQNDLSKILEFVRHGIKIYQDNINQATEMAKKFLKKERPYWSEKSIEQNSPKIAQEQLRVFIPTILPTAVEYTINLSTLIAIWKTAWTPVLRFVTDKMRQSVITIYPEIAFMFNDKERNQNDWSPKFVGEFAILTKPECFISNIVNDNNFINPKPEHTQPVDLLHFMPEFMDNNIGEIRTMVKISVATMGQDQRHRTIKRSVPNFSNSFYHPPLVANLKIDSKNSFFRYWLNDLANIPGTLHTAIAPYGAMVEYTKVASFNALLHEQSKRLCYCAQEEIYHLSRSLVCQLKEKNSQLQNLLAAPCRDTGNCAEGDRYCGRENKDQIPERMV